MELEDISKNNDTITLKITDLEFNQINKNLCILQIKYAKLIDNLYFLEQENSRKFNKNKNDKFRKMHKKIVISIIKDTLFLYLNRLSSLEFVFLSGSYAKNTNKLSSDLDLHFFYKNGMRYDKNTEEIICYIISRLLKKSRDCIDPTIIINLSSQKKIEISNMMSDKKLNIILQNESQTKQINYSFSPLKKRRFFLQYINDKSINNLLIYLNGKLENENPEYIHSFEIVYGKEKFEKMYKILYQKELELINKEYLKSKIFDFNNMIMKIHIRENLDEISTMKSDYQLLAFKCIYEYLSIIRMMSILNGYHQLYLNWDEILKYIKSNDINIFGIVFDNIEIYFWLLRKFTVYCCKENINYGLHTNKKIMYDTSELNAQFNKIKELMVESLERWCLYYE